MKIYTVTGIRILDPETEKWNEESKRTFTYYSNKDDALNHPNKCWIDMPGYYNYMVIEEFDEGVIDYDQKPIWMKLENGKYKECDPPKSCIDVVGFAMG